PGRRVRTPASGGPSQSITLADGERIGEVTVRRWKHAAIAGAATRTAQVQRGRRHSQLESHFARWRTFSECAQECAQTRSVEHHSAANVNQRSIKDGVMSRTSAALSSSTDNATRAYKLRSPPRHSRRHVYQYHVSTDVELS